MAHSNIFATAALYALLLAAKGWALRGGSRLYHAPQPERRDLKWDVSAIFNTPGIPTKAPKTPVPAPVGPETCTFIPDYFQSQIIVEYEGTPEGLSDQDFRSLEEIVMTSYADASASFCDDQFRQIFNVSIADKSPIASGRRKLQAVADASITHSSKRKFSYRFFVGGTCRACKKDSVFFDDGLRRKMQQTSRRDLEAVYARRGRFRAHNIDGLAESIQRGGTNAYGYSSQRIFHLPEIFN